MAGKIDDDIFKQYERTAHLILPNLPECLRDTYKLYIAGKGNPIGKEISKNILKDIIPSAPDDPSLETIIAACIYIALSKENLDKAISTYKETRRKNKQRWMKTIEEEVLPDKKITPRNPQLLREYATSLFTEQQYNRINSEKKSVEQFMDETFRKLKEWQSTTTEPVSNFFFYKAKKQKPAATAFINDVTLESLYIIRDKFSGSIDGFSVKYPTNLSDNPIVSYRNTSLDFIPQLINNELILSNSYEMENEDLVTYVTIRYTPETQIPRLTGKKDIDKVLKEYNINPHQRDMDMKDQEIVVQLFNMFSGETLGQPYIEGDLIDLARKVYNIPVPRKEHYEDLGRRLSKLKSYGYDIKVMKKGTDQVVETSSLGLINFVNISYVDKTFRVELSEQLKNAYIQKQYTNILSDAYKSIKSVQTRGIMMLLQQERLKEHSKGSRETTLTLKYFRSHMKFNKQMSNANLMRMLTGHLETLKEHELVVEQYQDVNRKSGIRITFLPLSDKEKIVYGYDMDNAIEDKQNIIDTHYKESAD